MRSVFCKYEGAKSSALGARWELRTACLTPGVNSGGLSYLSIAQAVARIVSLY